MPFEIISCDGREGASGEVLDPPVQSVLSLQVVKFDRRAELFASVGQVGPIFYVLALRVRLGVAVPAPFSLEAPVTLSD